MIDKLLSFLRYAKPLPKAEHNAMQEIDALQVQLSRLRYELSVQLDSRLIEFKDAVEETIGELRDEIEGKFAKTDKRLSTLEMQLATQARHRTRTQDLLYNYLEGGEEVNPSDILRR